jgi:two-component system chemotaxis response regulator CheY
MKSFLVVDDSKVVRTIARRMLEGFEFAVSEAENGKVALDACAQKMPDAVLLDWNMPVMSGIEFLRALRKAPGGDAPIVILCTTENDVNHIREAIEAGANEYIMKPFDQSILESKLAQVGLLDAPST